MAPLGEGSSFQEVSRTSDLWFCRWDASHAYWFTPVLWSCDITIWKTSFLQYQGYLPIIPFLTLFLYLGAFGLENPEHHLFFWKHKTIYVYPYIIQRLRLDWWALFILYLIYLSINVVKPAPKIEEKRYQHLRNNPLRGETSNTLNQ